MFCRTECEYINRPDAILKMKEKNRTQTTFADIGWEVTGIRFGIRGYLSNHGILWMAEE